MWIRPPRKDPKDRKQLIKIENVKMAKIKMPNGGQRNIDSKNEKLRPNIKDMPSLKHTDQMQWSENLAKL